MEIRRATESDYPMVAALSAEVGELHHKELPHILTPAAISEKTFSELLANSDCEVVIGVNEGETVGFLICRVIEQPETDYLYPQRSLYIQEMAVSRAHQRKGYGEALMNYAVEAAKQHGISQMTLHVWAFNQGAVAFYEHMGYKALTTKMLLEL